jgi:CRP-like cAMP-binding protein
MLDCPELERMSRECLTVGGNHSRMCVSVLTTGHSGRDSMQHLGMGTTRQQTGSRRLRDTVGELARRNRILAALPDIELRQLLSGADTVSLTSGQVLQKPEEVQRYAYFPTDTYVSQISSLSGIPCIEVSLVGAEGMIGSSLTLGVQIAPLHTVVQGAGSALRLDAARFVRELARGPALRAVMSRYLYVRMSQACQMVACTRFHTLEERLARWLLMARDRAQSTTFHMTQEYMACMLGVRRVGVTEAATLLRKRNLIQYKRGELAIVNGQELEAASCECYATAERMYRAHMN